MGVLPDWIVGLGALVSLWLMVYIVLRTPRKDAARTGDPDS